MRADSLSQVVREERLGEPHGLGMDRVVVNTRGIDASRAELKGMTTNADLRRFLQLLAVPSLVRPLGC